MARLHVRNVPDDLYQRLQRRVQSRMHSLSAEVVALLNQAVQMDEVRMNQGELLASMRQRRCQLPADELDSTVLLREDRAR